MNAVAPVRVLFVVNSLHFGGAEKHVVTLLNHLDRSRFEVSLVYLKNQVDLLAQVNPEAVGQRVLCAGVSARVDMAAARRVAEFIRAQQIDVVVATNAYSLLYSWLARRMAATPTRLVEVFHSTIMHTRKDRLRMLFCRPFFAACDMLVYVCRNQQTYWRARGLRARQDMVIHNGIDTVYYSARGLDAETAALRQRCGFAEQDFVIGLCGGLRPEKAHGDLLHAIARLRARGIPAKGCFIGDGSERARIEGMIGELGLTDAVTISGFSTDVRPWIGCCDIMTLVSHTETFSLAALEAMALGKPMVMSQVGGADEQVQSGVNGFLFPIGDVDALVACLQQAYAQQRLADMGAAARDAVLAQFSLPVMTGKFEQLLSGQAKLVRPVPVRGAHG